MGWYLKKNHKCELPSSVVFVDTETMDINRVEKDGKYVERHDIRLGIARRYRRRGDDWYGRSDIRFTNESEFWDWLLQGLRKKEKCIVFAHNWHYDAQVLRLWHMLDSGVLQIHLKGRIDPDKPERTKRDWNGLVAIGDRPFVIECITVFGSVSFVDTMNYFPMPLAKLGAGMNLPKLDKPADDASDEDWYDYCQRDVDIIDTAIRNLMTDWREENIGNWQPTSGRLALSAYRHNWMDYDIVIDPDRPSKVLERDSYVGGEHRNWYNGLYEGKVYHVDCNGLFPFAMRDNLFPTKLRDYAKGDGARRVIDRYGVSNCIARVDVCDYSKTIPVKKGKRTIYPQGEFTAVLAGSELGRAIDNERITGFREAASFAMESIFTRYINYWFQKRMDAKRNGNAGTESLAKIMMVSLYGKFSSKTAGWKLVTDVKTNLRWGHFVSPTDGEPGFKECRAIGGNIQAACERVDKKDSFCAISSFVTMYAREYMRSIREMLPVNSILSQCTDSLIMTDLAYGIFSEINGMIGDRLGQFKDVGNYNWIDIVDASHWESDTDVRMAGIPLLRERINKVQYLVRYPETTNDVIRRGPSEGVDWIERIATISVAGGQLEPGLQGWVL